ncbi:hypothetical protein D8M04_19485 [Oceanobacillus piezotolerans]|uniref:Uncharacterized protein n=1 Tax=Oceanobacillus piezotolerans TaxID=2448030 RepID=A0A498D149_9BACI|nr:hypothetical protein [Oceanobacillus piezotolerans]RLL40125.1 hypothetical protein D8M04_19485 [Oceanobacillus piezotolerans]
MKNIKRFFKFIARESEFDDTTTEREYEKIMLKEKEEDDDLFQLINDECQRIYDRVYSLYMDFQAGQISKVEMEIMMDNAKSEVKEYIDLAVNQYGRHTSNIELIILPAKQRLEELEKKISKN